MSLILFKSDNLPQSVIAAAFSFAGFVCVGYKGTNDSINYSEIDEKYPEVSKFYTFGDAGAPEKYEKIGDILNFIRESQVPIRIKTFLLTRFDLVYGTWMGMSEKKEYEGLDSYQAFVKLFFNKDFDVLALSDLLELANIKENTIKQITESLVPVKLGTTIYFRAVDYIHRRVLKELELIGGTEGDSKEVDTVCIYIDTTGFEGPIVMRLFAYGDNIPKELSDRKWNEFTDPFIGGCKCRVTDVPIEEWGTLMKDSRVVMPAAEKK